MDITQTELLKVVLTLLREGKFVELGIDAAILYSPFFLVMIRGLFNRREVRALYKNQLADKDEEIERLAGMVKELHTLNLRTKRK